jgi:hypothetical protein
MVMIDVLIDDDDDGEYDDESDVTDDPGAPRTEQMQGVGVVGVLVDDPAVDLLGGQVSARVLIMMIALMMMMPIRMKSPTTTIIIMIIILIILTIIVIITHQADAGRRGGWGAGQ